jgi:hypothetical protein
MRLRLIAKIIPLLLVPGLLINGAAQAAQTQTNDPDTEKGGLQHPVRERHLL